MLKKIVRLKVGSILLLGAMLICSGAFAMGERVNIGDSRGYSGEEKYYYQNGRWYRQDPAGSQTTVADWLVKRSRGSRQGQF